MKSLHIAISLMAVMQIPIAGAAASGTMLQELLDDFKAARARPSGTRPAPPDVDIGKNASKIEFTEIARLRTPTFPNTSNFYTIRPGATVT